MATVFLNVDESNYTISNNGDKVFGRTGNENVIIQAGVTGVVLDQNVEGVTLGGNKDDCVFEQAGNTLLVKRGDVLVATLPVQADDDGTQLTFDDGTFNAQFNAGVIEVGGDPVGPAIPGEFKSVDIGTIDNWEYLDAAQGSFVFTDDVSVGNFVEIFNFTADDQIQISNLPSGGTYLFASDGNDVDITYNYKGEGTINLIRLVGVGNEADLYDDEAGFENAIGFDAVVVI